MVLFELKRYIALFIIKYILGWRINRDYNSYEHLRKGKHVVVYVHTSMCEPFIGYLVSVAYALPLISVCKKELKDIPIISQFMNIFDLIYIDRQKNTNTSNYISDELNKLSNFIFTISPEGTRSVVSDIKSGFFYIAEKTQADIWIAR